MKIYQLKAEDSEIKLYLLYRGNTAKDFTVDYMKKPLFNKKMYDFSVGFDTIDISNIVIIYKHLIKKHNIV